LLSILIVNWNTRELLRACLTSIASHLPSEPVEVIVVDNNSTDGSAQMVQESFPNMRLIASRTNTGYAAGNNLAFGQAQGDWLLTLNPDTEFQDDALERALAVIQSHPDVGALGIKQIGVDGQVQSSVRGFPSVRGILGDLLHLSQWDSYRLRRFDYDKEQLAPQPMGTFLLFRRAALAAIGDPSKPFDEGFPIFFNEVDLLYRLDQKGWKTLYTPHASILHHGGESTRQVRKSMIWESHKSLVRFFYKHYGTGLARLGLPLLAVISYTAAFIRAKGYHAGFRA
jgi:GT2 family glycosyltransferase